MKEGRQIRLGDILVENADPHAVEPSTSYRIMGIYGFGRGPIARPPVLGSEIKAPKLFRVQANQFIYSRLKAFEGAFTIVPDDLDGYFVSNEFPTFDIDTTQVNSGFLAWMFRTKSIWQALTSTSKGMGARRERLHPQELLRREFFLPPLAEQHRITARLDRVAALIDERRSLLDTVDADADALLRKAFASTIDGADYLPMEQVAPLVRRPVDVRSDESYPELGVRSFGRGTFHKPALIGSELTWQKLFRIHEGDLVFSNIKAWEGAFAVAMPEDHDRVGSHRYLTCVPVTGTATAHFVCYYLQTREGLAKVEAASPGSADRNRTLGQDALAAITVPVPPIERQQWFDRIQAKVRELRRTRVATAADVEALIPTVLREVFGSAIEQPKPSVRAGDTSARSVLSVAS